MIQFAVRSVIDLHRPPLPLLESSFNLLFQYKWWMHTCSGYSFSVAFHSTQHCCRSAGGKSHSCRTGMCGFTSQARGQTLQTTAAYTRICVPLAGCSYHNGQALGTVLGLSTVHGSAWSLLPLIGFSKVLVPANGSTFFPCHSQATYIRAITIIKDGADKGLGATIPPTALCQDQ